MNNIWLLIFLFAQTVSLGMDIAHHGEEETKDVNAFVSLIGYIISVFIILKIANLI